MSKIHVSLIISACLGMSSSTWASWNQDCEDIQTKGPAQGACSAIQNQVKELNAYAPVKPFHDLSTSGSSLDSKSPWGSLTGGASGSSGGDSNVVVPTGNGGSESTPNDTSGTFN